MKFENIRDLAAEFVEKDLGVSYRDRNYRNINHLMMKAKEVSLAENPIDVINELAEEYIPESKKQKLMRAVAQLRMRNAEANDEATDNHVDSSPPEIVVKKYNLESRFEIGKASSADAKLDKVLEVYGSIESSKVSSQCTSAAKKYYLTVLNPICKCLNNHFNGDKQTFLQNWGDDFQKKLTKFNKEMNNGKGDSCGVEN